MTEREWCERLKKSSRLKSDADIQSYAEASAALKNGTDPEILAEMLDALNDIDAGEIQYELIEACESFPDKVYVTVFLDKIEVLTKKAPFWSELMLTSLLNAKKTRTLVIGYYREQSTSRVAYLRQRLKDLKAQQSLRPEVESYWVQQLESIS